MSSPGRGDGSSSAQVGSDTADPGSNHLNTLGQARQKFKLGPGIGWEVGKSSISSLFKAIDHEIGELRRHHTNFAQKQAIDGLTDIFNQELARSREDVLEVQNQIRELAERIPVGSNWDGIVGMVGTQSTTITQHTHSLSSINNSILTVSRQITDLTHRLDDCESGHLQLSSLVTEGGLGTLSFRQTLNPSTTQTSQDSQRSQPPPNHDSDCSRGRNPD